MLRSIALAALFLAGIVAVLPAADVTVAESPVPANSFAEVTLKLDAGDKVAWNVYPAPVKRVETNDGKEAKVLFNGPSGTDYAVLYTVVNFKTEKLESGSKSVKMGLAPQPPPTPPIPPLPPAPPGPQPDPMPTGVVKRFIVIEDTAQAGAWRGDILSSPAVVAYYKSAGLTHRLLSTKAEFAADDTAAVYIAATTGKKLPYLFTFDASGKVLSEQTAPIDSPEAFLKAIGGASQPRKMGNNPPANKKLRLAWKSFGESPAVPLIPRDKWKSVDLSTYLPPVHDQDGRGQCNASATCTATEAARAQAGLPYVYLSAGDLYSQINGGRDDGSLLEDGLEAMLTSGAATAVTVPYVWDGRSRRDTVILAERKKHRVIEAYICPDFDAMASALQQGFLIIEGLLWYDNFTPDRDGWLPARGAGSAGGHALCGYGIVQRGSTWGIRTRNSWGNSWGVGGNCIIPESLFGEQIGGFWAIRSVVQSNVLNTDRNPVRDTLIPDRFTLAP